MKGYRKLGEFIEVLNRRNTDMKLGLDSVRGISNTKLITETSKATVDENVISKFYVINPGEFVYNPRTTRMGDKVGLAFNNTDKPLLFTFNNSAFKIKDLMKDKLLPEYLYLFFCRSEFDRFARINSWGSATELFLFDDLCTIKFDPPDIKEQQKIVDTYNAITNRIQIKQKINENLEKTAQAIYRKMFIEEANEKWEKRKLGTLVEIKRGGSPRPIQDYIQPSGYRWLKISDATASKNPFIFKTEEYISEDGLSKTVLLKAGSLILSNSATPGLPKILRVDSCIHDGWLYFPKSRFSNEYLYLLFQNIREDLKSRGNGSIFTNLKTDILKEYFVYVPDDNSLWSFQDKIDKLFYQILKNSEELNELEKLKQLVVSQISKR